MSLSWSDFAQIAYQNGELQNKARGQKIRFGLFSGAEKKRR